MSDFLYMLVRIPKLQRVSTQDALVHVKDAVQLWGLMNPPHHPLFKGYADARVNILTEAECTRLELP